MYNIKYTKAQEAKLHKISEHERENTED